MFLFPNSGDMLLGDAFYATYFLLWELIRGGIDALFEQHGARKRSTDFSLDDLFGVRDHVKWWWRLGGSHD